MESLIVKFSTVKKIKLFNYSAVEEQVQLVLVKNRFLLELDYNNTHVRTAL